MSQVLLYGLALVASVSAVGTFRLAMTFATPLSLLASATAMTRLTSIATLTPRQVRHASQRLMLLLLGTAVLWIVFLAITSSIWSESLNISDVQGFLVTLLIVTLSYALGAGNNILVSWIRMHDGYWLRRRLGASLLEPTVGLAASAVWGASGAAAGMALHQAVVRVVSLSVAKGLDAENG